MWRRGGGCKKLSQDKVKCNLWLGTGKRLLSDSAANTGVRIPYKRCAFACVTCPILSAHRTHTHARAHAPHSAPLHPGTTPALVLSVLRAHSRTPFRSCVGTESLCIHRTSCCYERLTMLGVLHRHVDTFARRITTHVGAHEWVGCDSDGTRRTGVAHSLGARAECLRGVGEPPHDWPGTP
jgi:hypothetical protein